MGLKFCKAAGEDPEKLKGILQALLISKYKKLLSIHPGSWARRLWQSLESNTQKTKD